MKLRIITRAACALLGGLALGACTTASWQRLLYDVGDDYACQQRGANHRDAEAHAVQCADASHPDRTRYEDYKAARDQATAPQP
jgi:hypothetical protein